MSRRQEANAERWKIFETLSRSRVWYDTDCDDRVPADNKWYQALTLLFVTWHELFHESGVAEGLTESAIRRWLNANCDALYIRQFCKALKTADELILAYIDRGQLQRLSYSRFKHDLRAMGGRVAYVSVLQPLVAAAFGSANPEVLFGGIHQALCFITRFNPYDKCGGSLKWDTYRAWIELDTDLPDPSVEMEPEVHAQNFVRETIGGWIEDRIYGIPLERFGFGSGRTAEVSRKEAHHVTKVNAATLAPGDLLVVQAVTGATTEEIDRIFGRTDWLRTTTSPSCAILACVPKQADKYRTISYETTGKQWMQTGIGNSLVDYMHHNRAFRRHVDLKRAELNTEMARHNSVAVYPREHQMVTIDFSSASDRVSLALIRMLFAKLPGTLWVLEACRAEHFKLKVPDRNEDIPPDLVPYCQKSHPVRKYAGMGNRLTFPLEVVVFVSLCVAAIESCGDDPAKSHFRVYGDDVELEYKYYFSFMYLCERYGLVINEDKTFTGDAWPRFRESCGGHYIDGIDVTPVYLPRKWTGFPEPPFTPDPSWPISACALANEALPRLPDLRLYIIWKVKGLLPKSQWPLFSEDGTKGFMSNSPTNYHLERVESGLSGPPIPELSQKGIFIPNRRMWTDLATLDYQGEETWTRVRAGHIRVRYRRTVESNDTTDAGGRIKSLPFCYLVETLRQLELRNSGEPEDADAALDGMAQRLLRYGDIEVLVPSLSIGYDPIVCWQSRLISVPEGTSGHGDAAN